MCCLRHFDRQPAGAATTSPSSGSRDDPLRARHPRSPVQVHRHSARAEFLRLSLDVGIERNAFAGPVGWLSGERAESVRREAELPDRRAVLSMVALYHADVRAYQPAARAREHVQLVDGWTIRREA